MGAQCSTGMTETLVTMDPIVAEVRRALDEMVPKMLDFQVSGKRKDFEHYVEPYCKDAQTRFVFNDGKVATAVQVAESAVDGSALSNAELISVDTVQLFADKTSAVATMTVKCVRKFIPGTYEIARNSFTMSGSSMKSKQLHDIDKGDKVDVEQVVQVGERMRGKISGKEEWITLEKAGLDTQFVIFTGEGKTAQLLTYTTVLERSEEEENEYTWKLVHVCMQSRN